MSLENKINLLTEKINTTDFLISEMKKIGIEKLPYSQSSLKRFIDSKTMDVHYNGHYKTYVKKLNDALSKKNYGDLELEEIIKSISRFPKTIRNNGGGAFNHALFWKMLSPKKQEIPSQIKSKIIKEFGSVKEFENKFGEVAKERFGSGWCWLILTKNNRLKIMSTPNQDNPLMNVVEGGGFPLLGLDLWEHAYYLKYQNKRDEYIKNFWDVVNWEFVNKLYTDKTKTKLSESVKMKELIKEEVEVLKSNGRLNPTFVQTILKKVYPKCSPEIIRDYNPDTRIESPCYGKIQTELCKTNYGVIGGKYAVSQRGGTGEWSVVNWFDANTRISDKILEFYEKYNSNNYDLKTWFDVMGKTLFGDEGKFTNSLVNIILNPQTQGGTLNRGIEREKIAVDIFNSKYKDLQINQFCDGDTRDKYNGQDMFVTKGGVSKYVQVKPTVDLYESKDKNGNLIYIFKSKNKYNPNNIQIFAFIDNKDNYIFFDFDKVEVKDMGGTAKERFSYTFKPEYIKFKSPTIKLKKIELTESRKLIITKKQLQQITEAISIGIESENLLDDLCAFGDSNSIYCKFKNEVVDKIIGEEKQEVIDALNTIVNFYYPAYSSIKTKQQKRNLIFGKGIFIKMLELAMLSDLPGNFIKVIASFILDDEFDGTETKKKLENLKTTPIRNTSKLNEFLRTVRKQKYTEYEESLVGPYMKAYPTSLSLNYKCGENSESSFVKLLNTILQYPETEDVYIDEVVDCVLSNMESITPIKADLMATSDFYYDGKKVFSKNDKFEVKMMDTSVDSYLSEFFSIFKSSEISKLKPTHLNVYNRIITEIFNKIVDSGVGERFLNEIRKNLKGIIFEGNVLVPMENIEIYWSNKGQSGCKEKRLSIRFKVVESGITYIYNPQSNELELNPQTISNTTFNKIICP
jgi:superoxide dismutase, Fe-Mn family